MAQERTRTARTSSLGFAPILQVGLKGGFCGTTGRLGTGDPVFPEAPDWSQSLCVGLSIRVVKSEEVMQGRI